MSEYCGSEPASKVYHVGYSQHTRPFLINERQGLNNYLFRLQTEGRSTVLVQGEMCTILPGDLLLYRPGDAYELRIEESGNRSPVVSGDYFLFCQGTWIDEWWTRKQAAVKSRIPLDDAILSIWRQIIGEKRKSGGGSEAIADYLLRALCLSLDRIVQESGAYPGDSKANAAYRMRAFVENHATEPLTLKQVADHAGLSVSRAVHLFKETFGRPIMDYAIDVRLAVACERIRFGTDTLEQAAEQSGFASYSYFHRAFRRRYGMSPKQFREQTRM